MYLGKTELHVCMSPNCQWSVWFKTQRFHIQTRPVYLVTSRTIRDLGNHMHHVMNIINRARVPRAFLSLLLHWSSLISTPSKGKGCAGGVFSPLLWSISSWDHRLLTLVLFLVWFIPKRGEKTVRIPSLSWMKFITNNTRILGSGDLKSRTALMRPVMVGIFKSLLKCLNSAPRHG